jgi:hypothetical protein
MFKYFDAAPKSKGQGLLEYAVLVVLIAGVGWALVGAFTGKVNTLYNGISFSSPGGGGGGGGSGPGPGGGYFTLPTTDQGGSHIHCCNGTTDAPRYEWSNSHNHYELRD